MALCIRPSDLKYRYPKVVQTRHLPKFRGEHDQEPFNRDDIYDIIPLLEAVMDALPSDDARVLHWVEDLMNRDLPRCMTSRGEVFRFLTGCTREQLEDYFSRQHRPQPL